MNPYRASPSLEHYLVEAQVRAPLGPLALSLRVVAISEEHAVTQYREDLELDGFEIVGDVTARKT